MTHINRIGELNEEHLVEDEKELFKEVLEHFRDQYPRRRIEIKEYGYGGIVRIDGEDKFNTSGYNLLYNLKRLCDCLEDELL